MEWQKDSAYLPIAVAADMIENRDGDKRYVNLFGALPWALHNCWWQYRYSMDDGMLREKLYPLLRRSINLYLHMVEEGADCKLHLPKTYSPELGSFTDCNFDMALFKWGCHPLLHASQRLKIDDPLIPRWKEVTKRLVAFPVNEHGFMMGDKAGYPVGYRHLGSFLMIYPLYLVNIDQEGARELIEKSYSNVNVPGKMKMGAGQIHWKLGWGSGRQRQFLSGAAKMLPKLTKPTAQQRTTHRQEMGRSLAAPEHTRVFEALTDDGLAARLDHP